VVLRRHAAGRQYSDSPGGPHAGLGQILSKVDARLRAAAKRLLETTLPTAYDARHPLNDLEGMLLELLRRLTIPSLALVSTVLLTRPCIADQDTTKQERDGGAWGVDGFVPDDTADTVLGQPGMGYPFANRTDAKGLLLPGSVAVDASVKPYRLYVADPGNHRVLGYKFPLSPARPVAADLVIGQPDLDSAFRNELEAGPARVFTPAGVAVDAGGNVYISDSDYHRVLEFDTPFETDVKADRVFGQQGSFDSFVPNRGGISAGSLAYPQALCVDPRTGHLWVADAGNNRVLCYRSPLSTDPIADRVIGQKDFKVGRANSDGVSAASLFTPMGVALAGDDVVVSDSGNHRVLLYKSVPRTDATADFVFGQDGSFETAQRGCSPFRFTNPTTVTVDVSGEPGSPAHILVSDSGNNRVLMFALPDLRDARSDKYDDEGPRIPVPSEPAGSQPRALWGQKQSLHTNEPNFGGLGGASLFLPMGTALAPDGTLWVADRGNHRILGFDRGTKGDRVADRVIGQMDLSQGTGNFVDGLGFANPKDVAIDRSVQPNRLYVCDWNNNRVLGYASTGNLTSQTQPSLVIGQPDPHSNDPGTGRSSLFLPTAIAVDAAGGLFVVDRDNNRVLWFDRPFETDTRADRVFGQPDFESRQANHGGVSAQSLNRPEGVAVDAAGNLYVADTRNHRILRFDKAVATDRKADAVWGQSGSFTKSSEYGGIGVRSDTLSYPFGLDLSRDGLLAVADTNNHRVLLFDAKAADPFSAGKVFGQAGDFAGDRDNLGGCSAHSLSGPEGVAFWGKGLFVADTANCRVLWYNSVSENDESSFVYGQLGSFNSNSRPVGSTSSRSLWFPSGIDLDHEGNLYVADREHSRVLVFKR